MDTVGGNFLCATIIKTEQDVNATTVTFFMIKHMYNWGKFTAAIG